MPEKRYRNFLFTLNNYTTEELKQLQELGLKEIKYIILGQEIAPTTGTPHLQGFLIWNNAKTKSATIKKLPRRTHVKIANGTPYENYVYCSKDGNVCWEIGDRPEKVGQGKRTDMLEIKKKIKKNINIKTLLEEDDIVNYQQLKYAENLKKYYEVKRNWKTEVKWYYGATGTGKTKMAYEEMVEEAQDEDNIYFSMDTGKWWEGYDAQEYVIIDDMRADFLKFHQLLKLLDRYPYKVETKGSTRQFIPKKIIITSAYHPSKMFRTREDLGQLIRRIDVIKEFKDWRYEYNKLIVELQKNLEFINKRKIT